MTISRLIGVTVLGATGSIGVSTLDVLARHPERYRVVALTAHSNVELLFEQCRRHAPRWAVLSNPDLAPAFERRLRDAGLPTEVLAGAEALAHVAALPETDYVMAAIVGAAGLLPTLAAAEAGKRVLLANKEALVMSGALFMEAIRRGGAELLPIDSEHNAVFQCMPYMNSRAATLRPSHDSAAESHAFVPSPFGRRWPEGPDEGRGEGGVGFPNGVERILLTASGGPFRDADLSQLHAVTPEQACAHPNWVMGRKISVDSATMMNKGLEVIEACWLFDAPPERVEVVIHPQSVIHSMVAYADGSVLAQLGNPDMRTPIAHALAWPERMASGVAPLDIIAVGRLDFQRPDPARFPCLRLAYEALTAGGTASAVLNAANEVAVQAFLEREIRFTDIPRVIERTLERVDTREVSNLQTVLDADREAREHAAACIRDQLKPA
ncbi:MAG: 1-deoxy-D-xylulose-5-phosphate reductoisomerase [Chromatiales bacterium]|jgi:1-deoxy-D-xylulose-5-phosphate reductoisomerase|nr:1-deoxy-D-xylulose-5-phosphate reductoisomerase [Chromatiales bacterium]MDX9766146.1 1-deoxy-D-xylulose-5-phosphate reductoisomerase [Ectothiorhodospiraceae bacterium]